MRMMKIVWRSALLFGMIVGMCLSHPAAGAPQKQDHELYFWATAYTDTLFDAEMPTRVIHPRVRWAVIVIYDPSDDRQLAGRTYVIPGKPGVTLISPEGDKPFFELKIKGNGTPDEQKHNIIQLQEALRLPERDGLLTDNVLGAIFYTATRSNGAAIDLPHVRLRFFRADPALLPKYPVPLDGWGKQGYERDKNRPDTDKLPIIPMQRPAVTNAPNVDQDNPSGPETLPDPASTSQNESVKTPETSVGAALSERTGAPTIRTVSYAGNWWLAVILVAGLCVMVMGGRQYHRVRREQETDIEESQEPQDIPTAVEDLKAYIESFDLDSRRGLPRRPPVRIIKRKIENIQTLMASTPAPSNISRLIYRIHATAVSYTSTSNKKDDVVTADGLKKLRQELEETGPILIRAASDNLTEEDQNRLNGNIPW